MKSSYITPAVTLFRENGSIDQTAQAALYESLIENHMDGILVLGSIGEFFSMSTKSRLQLAEFAIRAVHLRTRLLVGASSMCFEEIAPFANECLELGADAVIVLPPYYFPLDSEGVFRYFDRLAGEICGPLYLYNFPDRTGYSMEPAVIARLARKHENIVGVKDTLTTMAHTRDLIQQIKPVRPDFEIFSGFDENFAHNVLSGGDGCIGGLSNVFPEICRAWVLALRENDAPAIARLQGIINRLSEIYTIGSSFIPVIKEALRLRGFPLNSRCTFPFPGVTEEQRRDILKLLEFASGCLPK